MSQKIQILRALKRGEKLTPMEALKRFGCFRLSGRILEIRREGYPVLTTIVERGEKHVAQYSMRRKAA